MGCLRNRVSCASSRAAAGPSEPAKKKVIIEIRYDDVNVNL